MRDETRRDDRQTDKKESGRELYNYGEHLAWCGGEPGHMDGRYAS